MICLFWGCPALRAGRAVSQLAGLLGPAALRALVWPAAPAAHPSAGRRFAPLWPCRRTLRPKTKKGEEQPTSHTKIF
nr:hypothetical protein [Saprospira grandis]